MHTSHVNSTQTYVARQPNFCSSRVPAHNKKEPSHSREPKLRSHTASNRHMPESFRMPPYIFCMGAAVMRRTGCVTRLLNAMRMKGRWQ